MSISSIFNQIRSIATQQREPVDTSPPGRSSAYDEGARAAEPFKDMDFSIGGSEGAVSPALAFKEMGLEEVLERAKNDPEFAAGFVKALGPEKFSDMVSSFDQLPGTAPFNSMGITNEDVSNILNDLGGTLASATRSGQVDAGFVQQVTGRGGSTEGDLDPELAAILLGEHDYTPETAAELAAHVILNDDPPALEPREIMDPHREALLGEGAWPTALKGVLQNEGASELLAIRGDDPTDPTQTPAARLVDPGLVTSSHDPSPTGGTAPRVNEIPALVGAVLDTPRVNLLSNPNDTAAIQAVESLVIAADANHGRVGEWAAQPLGALYMEFTGEILNAGEGASAFPLARQTPLGRHLADSGPLESASGANVAIAGLNAEGTPPYKEQNGGPPGMPPDRFGSWSEAIEGATTAYRTEVQEYGPPEKNQNGATYKDLNELAAEIADIDSEMLVASYGAKAIKAADVDSENQFRQDVLSTLSEYAGEAIGLAGGPAAGGAFVYNVHLKGPLLEHLFPTDNAQKVFSENVPDELKDLLAAQTVRIVDSAGKSGVVQLPDSLRDPATGGLRTPQEGADAEQFARDLADFIRSNETVRGAVDLAQSNLEVTAGALDTGQYRGGG